MSSSSEPTLNNATKVRTPTQGDDQPLSRLEVLKVMLTEQQINRFIGLTSNHPGDILFYSTPSQLVYV